jgi:NADPH:quinone reductase-like Zn-dependent oxidoreductase
MAKKMKVWVFDRYGTPDVLALRERDVPTPGKGEVLVKVVATGVNPSDVGNVGGHFKAPLPRVPGRDFAGVIVGGDGPVGTEVWGSGPGWGVKADGAHAEHVVLPADWISTRPKNITPEEAAAIGVPYLAAWSALVSVGNLRAGESVLVTGVSGAVGRAATQIAHWRGARVIGASISLENPSGADALIDTTKQDLASEALNLTEGKGVDLVLDAVGGPMFEACIRSLRQGGRQVSIASKPPTVTFNVVDFYHGMKTLSGVDTMGLSGLEVTRLMNQLRAGFEEGVLRPPRVQTWAFTDAPQAYAAVAQEQGGTKHVLKPLA